MKLGILSDTHAMVARTRQLADRLREEHVDAVIHCGDIGSETILEILYATFGPSEVPVHAVLGNVDYEVYPEIGVEIHGRFASLSLGGKRIAVIHGDDERTLRDAIASGRFDYVFTGHTHQRDDRTVGSTRIINPGALQRTAQPGGAVLDLDNGELRYLNL